MRRNSEEYPWLPLPFVEQTVAGAARVGASKVARGEVPSTATKEGFMQAYRAVRGSKAAMEKRPATANQTWSQRRRDFVHRHMQQVLRNNEPLFLPSGEPTRRHFGLLMWAYTPDIAGVKRWLKGQGAKANRTLKPRRNNPWTQKGRKGSRVQTVLFDRLRWRLPEARAWLREHGFAKLGVDAKPNNLRFRQEEPDLFVQGSFRTIPLGAGTGIQAVVGVPL
jgi:hypothetical protein